MGITREIAEQFEIECRNYFYNRWKYRDFNGQKGGITSFCQTIDQALHPDYVAIQRKFFFFGWGEDELIKNKQLRKSDWGKNVSKYDLFVLEHITPIAMNYSIHKFQFVTEFETINYEFNTIKKIWQRSWK